MADKTALRRGVRGRFPGERVRQAESALLCETLRAWPPFAEAAVIAAFVPLDREADIRPLLRGIVAEGRILALPRCEGNGRMTFRRVTSPDQLVEGPYHLTEPEASLPVVPPETIRLMLVPLEAADRRLNRLGKGGGYYDRYIPGAVNALLCGVALRYQLTETVPVEPHDRRLDALVTPDGLLLPETV